MNPNGHFDHERVEEILARMSEQGGENAVEAAYLRETIRRLVEDPVTMMLQNAFDRQLESMDAIAKDVPAAIAKVGTDITSKLDTGIKDVRKDNRHSLRLILVVVVLCLVLMAGLVGVSIILDPSGNVRVNADSARIAPASAWEAPRQAHAAVEFD